MRRAKPLRRFSNRFVEILEMRRLFHDGVLSHFAFWLPKVRPGLRRSVTCGKLSEDCFYPPT
jgi:hypothetical protein